MYLKIKFTAKKYVHLKLNLQPKIGLSYAISVIKKDFSEISVQVNTFYFSLPNVNY